LNLTCLARQSFDSEAFGLDFYRVTRFCYPDLSRDLASLTVPFMADAKLPAQDIAGSKALQAVGFRKVCVQATFALELAGWPSSPAAPEPSGRVDLPPELIWAHAANFPFSRFGLDPQVTDAERIAHQRKWLANSMASPDILKFIEGGDERAFVSFKVREEVAAIDLVSVLDPGRGLGSSLLGRLTAWAVSRGLARIEVTTESENIAACLFYQKNGFRLARAAVAFHLRGEA
jgi:GNAT superfamily N-acetyltransferase